MTGFIFQASQKAFSSNPIRIVVPLDYHKYTSLSLHFQSFSAVYPKLNIKYFCLFIFGYLNFLFVSHSHIFHKVEILISLCNFCSLPENFMLYTPWSREHLNFPVALLCVNSTSILKLLRMLCPLTDEEHKILRIVWTDNMDDTQNWTSYFFFHSQNKTHILFWMFSLFNYTLPIHIYRERLYK